VIGFLNTQHTLTFLIINVISLRCRKWSAGHVGLVMRVPRKSYTPSLRECWVTRLLDNAPVVVGEEEEDVGEASRPHVVSIT
jgi:hypothetical protein